MGAFHAAFKPLCREFDRLVRPDPGRLSRALALAVLFGFGPALYAPISEDAAQSDYHRMLWWKKQMQKKSPAELEAERRARIAEHNRRIRQALARPPIDNPYYLNPRNPTARRWVKHWLQRSTMERAGVKKNPLPHARGLSLLSSLVALAILAALGLFWISRPRAE